jgi:chromosome segregation ATPase
MENDQLEKRLEWLDDERRKDKSILSGLESRILELESKLDALEIKDQEMDSDLTRLRTSVTKVDDFEADLGSFRVDRKNEIKDQEKLYKSWIADAKKLLTAQINGLESQQKKLLDDFKRVKELEKEMKARIGEETRLNISLRDLEKSFSDVQKGFKEVEQAAQAIKVERQKDIKRTADIQGEISAVRKRMDEMRGLMDLVKNDYQKMKSRIQELEVSRRELRKEQEDFLEEGTLRQTEREAAWKNWMTRFESIEKQSKDLDDQMAKLDTTHRDVKRMQEKLADLSALFDRRVNEITEIQRLAEEKFRIEWNTFVADDQKRWTNHTISQKEQTKLQDRQVQESEGRIAVLEDSFQEIEDQLTQIGTYSESQLQSLLTLMRQWADELDQIMDGFR